MKSKNYEEHSLAIHQFGNDSSKNILICLHGFTHNGLFFKPMVEYILNELEKDYLIICPDFAGRGKSPNLESSKHYNYNLYIEDLELILSQYPQKNITVIGSSMGGLVAMMFAEKNPKAVQKLILNDIGNFIDTKELMKIGHFVGQNISFSNDEPANMAKRISEEFKEANLSRESFGFIKSVYVVKGHDNLLLNYDPKIGDAFWRKDKQKKLPDMNFVILWNKLLEKNTDIEIKLIRGGESIFFAKETAKKMLESPNVISLTEIPNIGHLPLFIDRYELTFLKDLI